MQNNGDGLGFCELQLGVCGLLEVVGLKMGGERFQCFRLHERGDEKKMKEMKERDMLLF